MNINRTRVAPMPRTAAIDATTLEKIVACVAQLLLTRGQHELATAQEAVTRLLTSDGARTSSEVRMAALSTAFSFGALDSLSRSMVPDLPIAQVLRLRDNAQSLHRAAHRSQDALDRLREAESGPVEERAAMGLRPSMQVAERVSFPRPPDQQRHATGRPVRHPGQSEQQEPSRGDRITSGFVAASTIGVERRVVSSAFTGGSPTGQRAASWAVQG